MATYLGDFADQQSVFVPFNTFDSNDPSASVTITDLADTDIHIHKDDGLVQHSAAADVDVQIDFDGITGNHIVEVRTTNAFFTIGADYFVRMEGTTVDGAPINAWIGHFSIENRFTGVNKIDANAITATSIASNAFTAAKFASNAITAVKIAAGALNGKGDWNIGKTGYALTTAGILAIWHQLESAVVTASTMGIKIKNNLDAVLTDRTLLAADYFDPAVDTVADVTLVGTTTTNTDMRGTDGANTTTPPTTTQIRDAVTGGAYALDTDANGAIRIVDGAGARELNTNAGAVALVDAVTIVNGLAAAVITAASVATGAIDADALAADAVNEIARAILPQQNQAFSDVGFLMVDETDHVTAETGLTVSGTRSIDGGAFGAITGTIAEIANGFYQLDASAADMNGAMIIFRFTATGADDTGITVRTAA